jgi:hypothetical protein
MISMVNNLLYVIVITLIYGIKITWKLPNILTHAGLVASRLPKLPWQYNFFQDSVPQRNAGREDYRDPVQFQV